MDLVAVNNVLASKEYGDHQILQNIPYFPCGLISVSLPLPRQREEYLREKLDKIDLKRDGLSNLDLHSFFRPRVALASHLLRKIVSKNILKMVDFKQMVALLDEAEVRLSSKAELAPQDILKIHRDLFNTLQDVPKSVILKRAAKISSKGNNKGKKSGGPPNKKPKPNDSEPGTYQAQVPVPVRQEGVSNESQTSVPDAVETPNEVSPPQEGNNTELGQPRENFSQQPEVEVVQNVCGPGHCRQSVVAEVSIMAEAMGNLLLTGGARTIKKTK